jgi:caffeoyl-CoA O-methyltransferase
MLSLFGEDLSRYVEDHADPEPALLAELREVTHRELADPQMQVGRVEGAFLRMLVQLVGARRVLEIGTYSGYSALCMAAGLPDDGHLVTCDIDPVATTTARAFFARSPHGRKIELRLGPAADTVAGLAERGHTFDFVFIDADKESYLRYWELVVPMVRPGGLVVADNTLWSGRVLCPTSDSDRGIVAFNERVRNDDRVERVLLSVRDGMMLARKRTQSETMPW